MYNLAKEIKMNFEKYLAKQMRQFSILDFGLVKATYFVFGLFIYSVYPAFESIDWWLYFIFGFIAAMPLLVHMYSLKGDILKRSKEYIKTNNPAHQTLLTFTMFFFALMLGTLFPSIVSAPWWVYFLIMILLAIKPLRVTWWW